MYQFFIPFEFNYQEFLKIPGYLLLIGIPLFRGIPNNRGDGTFFSIPVLRNPGIRGPDNRGPPVFHFYSFLKKIKFNPEV